MYFVLTAAASGAQGINNEITFISREEGSGTRGAFIELVGVEQKIDGVKTDMTTEIFAKLVALSEAILSDRRA